jgi:hypothetical protein
MRIGLNLQLTTQLQGTGGGGGGTMPDRLLDIYPDSTFAIALRQLKKGAPYPVVRIRRSGDDAEKDFNEVEIVNGTSEAWVIEGGSDEFGYINTMYGQQQNTVNDWTNSVAATQTWLIDTGVLQLENGEPTVRSDNTRKYFSSTAPMPIQNPAAYCMVAKKTNTSNTYVFALNTSRAYLFSTSSSWRIRLGSSITMPGGFTFTHAQQSFRSKSDGGGAFDLQTRRSGSVAGEVLSTSGSDSTSTLNFYAGGNSEGHYESFQEFILFNTVGSYDDVPDIELEQIAHYL